MSRVILPLPTSCLQEAGVFSEYIRGGDEDWDDKNAYLCLESQSRNYSN